jgi:hypothetical protein
MTGLLNWRFAQFWAGSKIGAWRTASATYRNLATIPSVLCRFLQYLSTPSAQNPYNREDHFSGRRAKDFDLSNFPETLEWEFPAEAIKATAQIINDQALEIEELKRKKAKVKSLFRKFFHR